MNSAKSQDIKSTYRNQLHFYTPIMKHQKEKSRNQSHSQLPKKHKITRNKPKQSVKNLYTENYTELMKEIEKDTQKNGKHSMLMDWKNKHC